MKKPYRKELPTKELAALSDEEIDTSDIAELGRWFWDKARVVMPEERNKIQVAAKFDAGIK